MPGHTRRSRPPRPRSGPAARTSPGQPPGPPVPRPAAPRTDPARRAAYDVLRAVADRDAYANLLLPALLTERGLTGRDAAFATELTYGTLRGRGTYDAILAACSDRDELDPPVRDVLRLGAHQLLATRVGQPRRRGDLGRPGQGRLRPPAVRLRQRGAAPGGHPRPGRLDRDRRPGPVPGPVRLPGRPVQLSALDRRRVPRRARPGRAAETEDALAAGNVRPEVVLALSPALRQPVRPRRPRPGRGCPLPDGERTRWSPYGFRLAGGDPAPLVASGRAAVQDEASQLAALALARVGRAWPRTSSGSTCARVRAARPGC